MSFDNQAGDFLSRFDRVVRSYRRMSVSRILCWTLLVVLIAFFAVAAVDFLFEVDRAPRAVAAAALLLGAGAGLVALGARASRRASDHRVASEVERRFPELGQAVRTTVQFRRRNQESGVSETLVTAMRRDISDRSVGLPLDQTVPAGKFYRAATLLAGAAIVLVALVATSWEWRTAALRVLFGDQPYTEVEVVPGDTLVEEGASLRLAAKVQGRTARPTMLMTRPLGSEEAGWTRQELSEVNIAQRSARRVIYEVDLPDIREPLEYRVAAGRYLTPRHRINVRHPLEIESIRVELEPPAYTGLAPTVVDEGSFHAVAGSQARFEIVLDRPTEAATMTLTLVDRRTASDEPERMIPLNGKGKKLTAQMELTEDVLYSIEGRAADGSNIRQNRYRIRVREDRPPRITFDQPPAEIEVHSLAEMVMRARAEDDYGLTRSGIVFQVNNGQEYPLVLREFQNEKNAEHAADGADQSDTEEIVKRTELEKVLPLEYFELTQKDSVMYYAFAEDNAPGGPRRVQTDLQFIDIRPFRRLYRAVEGGGGGGGGGPQLTSLEELISRERFVLNRSLRLARAAGNDQRINLEDVDLIIRLQQETAELTRELADSVAEFEDEEGITDERVSDLFYSAEEAMLAAMDSLSVGNYDTASLQEQDAVRYLVEARNAIEILIGQGGGGALSRLFQANRRLLQKLRRPKTDVERAAEAARTLRTLADREDDVYDALRDMLRESMQDAGDADARQAGELGRMQRREIEDKQLDISLDVERIDDVVQEIEGLTELTRTRSADSVEMATAVTNSLERGSTGQAADQADSAAAGFRDLADQLEGVTALEPAGRIAVARDLASRVAIDFRSMRSRLAEKRQAWQNSRDDAAMDADESQTADELSKRTNRLVDSTATIEDILNSIVETYSAEQDSAVARIERLLSENELPQVTDQMQRLDLSLVEQSWQEADLEMSSVADRMDGVAQRLDAIHRSLVAPRVEQLRAFELRAVELAEALVGLSSEGHVTRWHQKADGLLEDLAAADVQLESAGQLVEAMEAAGWSGAAPPKWGWQPGADQTLIPPEEHVDATHALVAEIQRYIQELIVGGIYAADADAVPPEYIHFVRRYLEALSQDP